MKKLVEVASIKSFKGKNPLNDEHLLWVKAVGEFKVLKSIGRNKPEYLLQIIPGKTILIEYLYHILERPLKNLAIESDTALPKLSIARLKSLQIPVPSLKEQEKILGSKNISRRFQKLWLENGIRSYDESLKVDMSFDELLKILSQPKE
jgi:hypothetical protein